MADYAFLYGCRISRTVYQFADERIAEGKPFLLPDGLSVHHGCPYSLFLPEEGLPDCTAHYVSVDVAVVPVRVLYLTE